jgi:uncharacterized protein YbjT (DUF2867 family)
VILVAGGTGRLGTVLVNRWVDRGEEVRVLTRDPGRAAHLPAVEVVRGDVRDPGAVATAVRGADVVVSAVHGFTGWRQSPASVDREGNRSLITAAAAAGAHVVLLSVVGASAQHPLELFRMKAAAEEILRGSGASWAIVRAGAFRELYEELVRRSAGRSGRPLVFGRGENPILFAAVGEVAAAVDRGVHEQNRVIEVGGEILTFDELAAGLEPELGPGARRPRHVPRPVLRAMTLARTTPPGRQAAAALVMDTEDMVGAGRADSPELRG